MTWDLLPLVIDINRNAKHGMISTAGCLGRLLELQAWVGGWGVGSGDLARSTQSFG